MKNKTGFSFPSCYICIPRPVFQNRYFHWIARYKVSLFILCHLYIKCILHVALFRLGIQFIPAVLFFQAATFRPIDFHIIYFWPRQICSVAFKLKHLCNQHFLYFTSCIVLQQWIFNMFLCKRCNVQSTFSLCISVGFAVYVFVWNEWEVTRLENYMFANDIYNCTIQMYENWIMILRSSGVFRFVLGSGYLRWILCFVLPWYGRISIYVPNFMNLLNRF